MQNEINRFYFFQLFENFQLYSFERGQLRPMNLCSVCLFIIMRFTSESHAQSFLIALIQGDIKTSIFLFPIIIRLVRSHTSHLHAEWLNMALLTSTWLTGVRNCLLIIRVSRKQQVLITPPRKVFHEMLTPILLEITKASFDLCTQGRVNPKPQRGKVRKKKSQLKVWMVQRSCWKQSFFSC